MSDSNLTLKQKAYHEMKEFFVIACYLWLVFALLVLYKWALCPRIISLLPRMDLPCSTLWLSRK